MNIRKATAADAETLAGMAAALFHHEDVQALRAEFAALAQDEEAACFLAEEGGAAVGFAQCQLRHDYVEGTETSPVGYLEGVYVKGPFRRRGVAGQLLRACEAWAEQVGCTEFASDCELDNTDSLSFHLHMGFEEANRIICLTKKLRGGEGHA